MLHQARGAQTAPQTVHRHVPELVLTIAAPHVADLPLHPHALTVPAIAPPLVRLPVPTPAGHSPRRVVPTVHQIVVADAPLAVAAVVAVDAAVDVQEGVAVAVAQAVLHPAAVSATTRVLPDVAVHATKRVEEVAAVHVQGAARRNVSAVADRAVPARVTVLVLLRARRLAVMHVTARVGLKDVRRKHCDDRYQRT